MIEKIVEEPKMTNGVVVFLDALGTKGIYKRRKLSEIVSSWKNVLGILKAIPKHLDVNNIKSNISMISDTIILTMENTNILIASQAIGILIAHALTERIYFRGAISMGEYYYQPYVPLIGPAVDDAAKWHETTDWIGAILTPKTQKEFEDLQKKNPPNQRYLDIIAKSLINYQIPYKENCLQYLDTNEGWAVNWPFIGKVVYENVFIEKQSFEFIPLVCNSFKETKEQEKVDETVINKFNETYAFYQFVEKYYFERLKPYEKDFFKKDK